MLTLSYHGGKCCGIKTIHGFCWIDPKSNTEPALERIGDDVRDCGRPDMNGYDVKSDLRFFWDEAPKETSLERFDRYLEYLKTTRPKTIVECVIVKTDGGWSQTPWEAIFFERGFKLVTEHKNSNTSNVCSVYHLCLGAELSDEDAEEMSAAAARQESTEDEDDYCPYYDD